MEAHAEDCILVPPDAEAALPREPIVFDDEDAEGGEVSRPSLGQQVSAWPTTARAAALSRAD